MMNMLMGMAFKARYKIESFFKKENGEVNIIAIVVLIGIAIALALIFKDKIKDLLNTLFDTIKTKATKAVS